MMASDLKEELAVAMEAAREAGALIKTAHEARGVRGPTVTVKSGIDLVTETDQACENLVLSKLKSRFPDYEFVGEESTFAAEGAHASHKLPPSKPTWFVDPLDGTTNFVHGYPFVAVSIGLTIGGVPVLGVVYNPILDEMYTAVKGQGAFLNGKRLRVSSAADVNHAMIVNNIGKGRDGPFISKTLNRLDALLANNVQALRASGSCAVNMAHVASGVLDACYEDGYGGPWDVAAGHVLVTEAGGVVRTPEGGPFTLYLGEGKILCGPPRLCDDIARIIVTADARKIKAAPQHLCPRSLMAGIALGTLAAFIGVKFFRR